MVGLVLVSHSYKLAEATLTLTRAMSGDEVPIVIAAGCGDDHQDLGTDAMEIYQAITSIISDDGVVVLMDMGSAILSTDMALDFLDEDQRAKVKLCSAPFVEGAVAAGVACKIGSNIDDVITEAKSALKQKTDHLADEENTNQPVDESISANALTQNITIKIPNGIHARPATELTRTAAQYKSNIQIKNLTNGKGPVSAKSMTGVVSLEALYGQEIQLIIGGEDASQALEGLTNAINAGLGDSVEKVETNTSSNITSKQVENKPIGVARGIVIGHVYYPENTSYSIADEKTSGIDVQEETSKLEKALNEAKATLALKEKESKQGAIFKAQGALLEDPALLDKAKEYINQSYNAVAAWWKTIEEAIVEYKNFNDANLRQRALDLQDVERTVLEKLGLNVSDKLEVPYESIIIVDDITPSQVDSLDTNKVKGVICIENGQTSHSSILLRSRGIPTIVQAQHAPVSVKNIPDSAIVAMNGETAEIVINPDEKELSQIKEEQAKIEKQIELEKQDSFKPAITQDNVEIEVFANVGRREDAEAAAANGADGIGLLRTEFMFLDRTTAPTEDEQVETLSRILEPMKGKPIIIRTLDAGGDKEIPYLNMPKEANPFLGIRAIRLCLRNKPLFQEQLRAILRVSHEHNVQIMFPMISTIQELREAKEQLNLVHEALVKEGIEHQWPIKAGMMMEVPSAAIMAHEFAKEADFFSIGTNDLVQYTMAADRGNPELQSSLSEGLDPSVIHLIKHIADAAKTNNITVAVCGESASNPNIAPVLMGLGVTELSMNARSISQIKYLIRNNTLTDFQLKAKDQII